MHILDKRREDGTLPRAVRHLRPLPDPAHVGKCVWDGLCNWSLVEDDYRICMQFLRTLREDSALPQLAKKLPLFPLTCRDQQAPENLLHASTDAVVQQLQTVEHVCHQLCPEKWRKWDGNNRQLEHPLAIAAQPNRLAFLEGDSGRISLGSWHSPFDVKQSSSAESAAHGLTFVGDILFVTVPGAASIQYLEAKAGSSEVAVGQMKMAQLRKELHARDVDTTGKKATALRHELKSLLDREREAKFGADPGANDKERKQARAIRPRLRPLVLQGERLQRPLGIAAHPSERRIAVADGNSRRIALIDLKVQGVQQVGSCRFVGEPISATAELTSLCWIADDMLIVADSSPGGGLWSVDVKTGAQRLELKSGSQLVDGRRLPMKPWGVAFSAGRLYYTDAAERTVRELSFTDTGQPNLSLIAGSGREGTKDGTGLSCSFVQPTGIAVDGASLLVCDTGGGRICVISRVAPLVDLLGRLRRLYETFGLHLRGKTVARQSLLEGIANMEAITDAFEAQTAAVRERVDKKTVNGPDGAISNDSLQSLRMLRDALRGANDLFVRVLTEDDSAADYRSSFALKACGQNPLERFFSKMRQAVPMPTVLEYCQNKMQATQEMIKQMTRCAFFYPTPKQFYPDPELALAFSSIDLPRKKTAAKQKQVRVAYTEEERRVRREYVAHYFRPAPQSTVRSYCKFKAGTPPLSSFGHRVELKAQPMDLDKRAEDLSANAGMPLPDRERNADPSEEPNFVFLAVLPGGQPRELVEEDLYVVAVDGAYYDNKQYDPLEGYWMVPHYLEPQVFRFMAKADLHRQHILAEIAVEAYEDEENEQLCAAVDETTLHRLLVKSRKSAEEMSVPDDENPRLESDAFPFFGLSQRMQSLDDGSARNARAIRRGQRKAGGSEQSKSASKPKAKAKPKKGATKGTKHRKSS
jgi:hypothetical protein